MRQERSHPRFIRRLEIEFSTDKQRYRGITRNCSLSGIFIKTNHAFTPGTMLDMTLHLPEGSIAKLRGCVRSSMKTPIAPTKNGMGIELLDIDKNYAVFINTFLPGSKVSAFSQDTGAKGTNFNKSEDFAESPLPDFVIVKCPQCGVKNKLNRSKGLTGHKCGKCRSLLEITEPGENDSGKKDNGAESPAPDFVIVKCPQCGVKNKLNRSKGLTGHKCGKCRTAITLD